MKKKEKKKSKKLKKKDFEFIGFDKVFLLEYLASKYNSYRIKNLASTVLSFTESKTFVRLLIDLIYNTYQSKNYELTLEYIPNSVPPHLD